MEETIKRIEELDTKEKTVNNVFYNIIIEILEPRGIEEILLSTADRVPDLLMEHVSRETWNNIPKEKLKRSEFSFLDIINGIPRKITVVKVVLHD